RWIPSTADNEPASEAIVIDIDAAGVGWFVDPSPTNHFEFDQTLAEGAFRATSAPAAGKYDLLTVLLHEVGHLEGILPGNPAFDRRIVQTIDGSQLFVGPDFTATLSAGGDHLDETTYPNDLMSPNLPPGVRRLPSRLDVRILKAVQ